ncbi:MAG: TonB-dependent receptor, partial [Gammaproteobacteria bacterium]|nr:TonB-dependent receptor [Gammaproteobacteria bacterium]
PPVLAAEGNADEQRAAELLSLGRIDEARLILETSSNSAAGLALQSVIAIALNDLEAAQKHADDAAAIDASSPAVAIAMSYVKQSQLKLEEAQAVIESALSAETGNALLWARAGELRLMSGRNTEALAAANRASQLDPNSSQANLVNGFAALSTFDTAQAAESFRAAIDLNSADPMGYLGLGLTQISEGDLEAGRNDIEIAVSLDSNNAILRSYLGKAYFEEKRSPLEDQQFEIAQQLDSNDPTPWFYQSISQQTRNDPVQALQSQQKAIELNDNRAVYRSRLLLDSDRAARGISLGRVYSDLGFEQLALAEGWKSVNTDPTNSSAHLFLADSYSALPRHEIARVSEALQAQMLQPVNAAPVNPTKAEGKLLLAASGPAAVGYNEYNALFDRNQTNAVISGMVGEHGTSSTEAIVSGLYGKTAFSAGIYHFETEGFRDSAFQEDDIGNLFVQHDFSSATSVQFELRSRETEYGDLTQKFHDHSSFPGKLNTEDNDTLRLGARHSFAAGSTLLLSITDQEGSKKEIDDPFPQELVEYNEFDSPDRKAQGGELQYLYRSAEFSITGGMGTVDSKEDVTQFVLFDAAFFGGPPGVIFSSHDLIGFGVLPADWGLIDADIKHENVYLYSNINLGTTAILTLGVSRDEIDSELVGAPVEKTNPKFGITWVPNSQTTVRLASFETVKRTLSTQQTLEPTQVAGFNQFFDDYDSSETKHSGIAIDYKFNLSLSAGVEISKRDIAVPTLDILSGSLAYADWEERMSRAYLYWTPSKQWAFKVEYLQERLDRGVEIDPDGVVESDTDQLALGASYFHSAAISATMTATKYDQEGIFGGFWATDSIEPGEDNFWLVDAAVNYHLAARRGVVTFGVTNLTDEEFSYFDLDLNNARLQPARTAYAKLSLSFL